ncbi:hypothetical protein A2331_04655 [Candidatus Falkowbacteria bacterium RIFOXYB2_FULL_34_18]|uniref:Uncharacterized protein n=1 Tax=Candidatus Falkowbacteria bacterium RIFOXYD2_FULL_34_120 TaxID=1798007 RepID=A0A1F5TQ27_9BACT|nr:MAG: hypothetical protein A2331_04655 [Candidatus Falkowbacteria bacterium RIFOXYB2_FULL_34_18]OGF29356.1 MAG: hypothetical protein A2500_06240 [Candidatus Falkowbacteria bacterium RIFOXYC12_FULL_34_55]OGF36547.1 MAG: hypothetical protein A2466_07280 [Candidatus Falkowbacteria bacterium RIFOXYC2_FULL_34_220]OGF38779.1 MAG: hypothetical protein A2515_03390 [Candidatus Falkowbacteria bacterium RIFOXYD12_FULL_34_57]OGF41020.1 MAG: hypothetical protein A2531_03635 [Candidatus Falkowbacteria bact
MYRTLMNQRNFDFVARAVACLVDEVGVKGDDENFWICYGSFVLNQQTVESDLDLLCIHTLPTTVRRIQSSFEGYPVTIYSLNRNDFVSDGRQKIFGGYFGGKVLNPHVMFLASQKDMDVIAEVGGAFIGPFSGAMAERKGRTVATDTNLVADSVLARFHLCPWYRSYFLRYYTSSNFQQLWERMTEVMTSFFLKAGIVIQDGNKFRYQYTFSDEELHESTLASVARFWSLGSSLHSGMPDFPAFYMQKAEQYVKDNSLENRLEEMIHFLQVQSD